MIDFIIENQKISWLALVAIFTISMLFIVRFFFKKAITKAIEKHPFRIPALQSIRQILLLFFTVLGIALASYIIFNGDRQALIYKNIERIIWIALVAVFTRIGVAFSRGYFRQKIEKSYQSDQHDPTTYKFLNSISTIFIYIVGLSLAIYVIPSLRFLAASALTGAGVIALVIGVASQEAIGNIASGAFIVMFKPFKIGHIVQIGTGIKGVVEDLTLRHTVIRDFHNQRVVIPNSLVNKEYVTNFYMGDPKSLEYFEVGISYDSDVDLAMELIKTAAKNHPSVIDNRTPKEIEKGVPEIDVRVIAWADSSVSLRAYIWVGDSGDGPQMRHHLLKTVKAEFEANGIEIPFPHRVIIQKQEKS